MNAPAISAPKKKVTAEDLNDEQRGAIDKAWSWYKRVKDGSSRRLIFRLGGYAGTGKTTIAQMIADLCTGGSANTRTQYIAPTGKAASRLRQKGCDNAQTMHQFMYRPVGEDEEGEIMFASKASLDYRPSLIIMDESSMVGDRDLTRLMDYEIPLLCLGDIGQLPPVKDRQVFHARNLDVLLEQIERNAGNIVRASMFVRQGNRLPFREYEDVRVRPGKPTDDQIMEHIAEEGQMLSAYHSTRHGLNTRARNIMGHSGKMMPQIGEKLVCRFNQHGHGIMNGEQGILLGFEEIPEHAMEDDDLPGMQYIRYKSLTYGKEYRAKFNPMCFNTGSDFVDARAEAMKKPGAWDFGYCLTIHSSQGSEWEKVLMMDELMRGVPYEQLAYTGITRAISRLTMYREGR